MRNSNKLRTSQLTPVPTYSRRRAAIAGLLLILIQISLAANAQSNIEPIPDSKDALKQTIQHILKASKQREQDQVAALVKDLIIQDPGSFFGQMFEETKAEKLATQYSQNSKTLESYLLNVFTKFGMEKKTSVRVKQLTKEKDGKPKSGRAYLFANMDNTKALYTVELKGSRKTGKWTMGYFVRSNGGFHFAGGLSDFVFPVRVSSRVQEHKKMHVVPVAYPEAARQARIVGTVRLEVLISSEGFVQRVKAASGPAELHNAAIEAVRQWLYAPTLLQGQPIPVITLVDVTFKLR